MDLRSQRSQKYLWRGFYELMTIEKIAFSKLTINQICEAALVHRSTFYKHFTDKYALLNFGLNELFTDYQTLENSDKARSPFYWANYFFEHSQAQLLLETQKKDPAFTEILHLYSLEMMGKSAKAYLAALPANQVPVDLQVEFLVSTVFTLSLWQTKQKTPISIEEMDAYYQQLINQQLFFPTAQDNTHIND